MATDRLSTTFAALADPTRRAILASLATGEKSVTELAAPIRMSLPGVSKHLKVLERAGLISRGREAQWRPCRLEAEPIREVSDWAEEYRRQWEQRFDRLEDYLAQLQAGGEPRAGGKRARPTRANKSGRGKQRGRKKP
jgi:DNA-binding transcriptional ArsR family regulator